MSCKHVLPAVVVVSALLGFCSPAWADTPEIYCERGFAPFDFNFCIATNPSSRNSAGLGNPTPRYFGIRNAKMRVELVFRGIGVPIGQEQILTRGPDIDGIPSGGTTRTGGIVWWQQGTFCARLYITTHWWMDWGCLYNYPGGWYPDPSANHISGSLIGVPVEP